MYTFRYENLITFYGYKILTQVYISRFSARNDVGLGQWSAIRVQGTPSRSVPQSPKILNQFVQEEGEIPIATSVYADKFEMTWSRPPDNGEPIDFYSIKYCPVRKHSSIYLFIMYDYNVFICWHIREAKLTTYGMKLEICVMKSTT